MKSRILKFLAPAMAAAAFVVFSSSTVFTADPPKEAKEEAPPPYEKSEATRSILNPHEQITDEGEIRWDMCLVCHGAIPDIKKERSIKDTNLRDPDDPNKTCFKCHPIKPHPAAEGSEATMSGYTAPNHLVVPPKTIGLYIRFTLKELPTIMPLDPKSGKIICATCHNPHERGLLIGKADFGSDQRFRLRTPGVDICQYCHRK